MWRRFAMEITSLLDRWPPIACVFIVLSFVVAGFFVLFKYEGQNADPGGKEDVKTARSIISADGNLYTDELWIAGGGSIHPGWLLGFRVFAFLYLLPIQFYNIVQLGGILTYFYYTQWTFTLLTAYFGLAACISAINIFPQIFERFNAPQSSLDATCNVAEGDSLLPEKDVKKIKSPTKGSGGCTKRRCYTVSEGGRSRAGVWGYVSQIGFQVLAPAVLLTDGVYWLVLVPFILQTFTHDFVDINMHGVNALFLFTELFLNDMRFPWFRGGYLVMWSAAYIFYQWILHLVGFIHVWPYPFLDVSTPYAPAWYLGLSLFHLVCFCICLLLAQVKQGLRQKFSSGGISAN